MSNVAVLEGEKLLVQVGDGGSPTETFAHDCLINAERAFELSAEISTTPVPDCFDASAPAWNKTRKTSIGATISGAGLLHTSSHEAWYNWLISKNTKNVKVKTDTTGAAGGQIFTGAFHLTKLTINGTPRDGYINVSVELVLDGALTQADAA